MFLIFNRVECNMATDEIQRKRDARRKMMLESPILRVIPVLSIPTVISMLIDSFYNIADTFFVSQIGTFATAAVGVNDSLMMLIRAIAMGFGMGAASYISRLLGAKREDEASKVGSTAFFTTIIVSIVFAIVCFLLMDPLVTMLGSTENSKEYTMQYARIILIAAPLTVGEVVLSQLLRSEGSTNYSMIGMVSGCVLNIGLDPLFISVFGWGVSGAAGATAISKLVSFVVLLTPFIRQKTVLEVKFRFFTPKWYIYKEVARMGVPTFLRTAMLSVSTIVTNNIAGGFGDSTLAAISVGNKCMRFIGAMIIGFGQGFQPVAGYCWGAKKYKRVLHAFWVTSAIGAVVSIVFGVIMAIFAPQIIGVFTSAKDPGIIRVGTYMIRAQSAVMIIHMWVMVIGSLFQALGRAINSTILNLSRQVICLIPCVIILSYFFGEMGLASAQAVADCVSMLIALPLLLRLLREFKTYIQTEEQEALGSSENEA